MTRLTIVPSDKLVMIDGEGREVDCSGFYSLNGVHAVQWDGTKGHIEYLPDQFGTYRSNEQIFSIAPFQEVIGAWYAAPAPAPLPPPPPGAIP
jgi:hypothetical protein